jgi:hypothetical protein
MKKRQYLILTLIVLMGLILAACNGADAVEVQPDQGEMPSSADVASDSVAENDATELPTQATEDTIVAAGNETPPPPPGDLPEIPMVDSGPGSAWFKPTDPSEFKLATGQVQVIKFSAVW